MATYYIDYAAGSDSNNGTSSDTPWKHCPGDENAEAGAGKPGTVVPAAGSTINFKGGVRYYGKVALTGSGSLGNQITYEGDASVHGWGTGKAIIDGTVALSLTQCSGEGTGAGQVPNSNYSSIYHGTLPAGAKWLLPVIESDVMMNIVSTSLTNPKPFFYTNSDYFKAISSGITGTQCTDAAMFNQADSEYWVGAMMMYSKAGSLGYSEITSFNPATDTVSYADGGAPYQDANWDNKYHYQVANSPRLLSAVGQRAIDVTNGIIYVWPTNPANVRVASLTYAFSIGSQNYVTISGFITNGHYGGYSAGRIILTTNSSGQNGVVLQNCDFKNAADLDQDTQCSGATYIRGAGTAQCRVENCTYSYLHGRGAFVTGTNTKVAGCEFSYVDGTCVYTQNYSTEENTDGVFDGNFIHDCYGIHANGITVYGATSGNGIAKRWVVSNNRVLDFVQRQGPGAFTAQGFWDLEVYNNLFEADQGAPIDGPASGCNYIRFYNNTLAVPANTNGNPSAGVLRCFNLENTSEFTVTNNICNGLSIREGDSSTPVTETTWAMCDHSHNIFTGLTADQTALKGWTLGGGDSEEINTDVFVAPASSNYLLKFRSPAIGTGEDLSAVFSVDLSGIARTIPWDIGAYAYVSSAPTGYLLERSADGGSSWTQIADVGANIASLYDTGLSSGATYSYRVGAYDAAGAVTYSNVGSATTPAAPAPGPGRQLGATFVR